MTVALVCPRCGAPLPRVPAGASQATCAYCGATAGLGGLHVAGALEAATSSTVEVIKRAALQTAEAFKVARSHGTPPFPALVAAGRAHLGPLGETDAFARVVLGLGLDFDRQNGTSIVNDAMSMARLIETYMKAVEALRSAPTYDANMPFFSANAEGPVHFVRRFTAADIANLAAQDPDAAPKKKEKNKGFWPFG